MRTHARSSAPAEFAVQGSSLIVRTDLYWEKAGELERQCALLLGKKSRKVILDLTGASFISSYCFDRVVDFMTRAVRAKKRVRIRVTPEMSWCFRVAESHKMADIDICERSG